MCTNGYFLCSQGVNYSKQVAFSKQKKHQNNVIAEHTHTTNYREHNILEMSFHTSSSASLTHLWWHLRESIYLRTSQVAKG